MVKKTLFTLFVILLLGTFAQSASATHSWGGYHWARTVNPLSLKLGSNLTSSWSSFLQTASSDWSQSDVLDTTVVAGGAKGNCQPTSGRVEVCNKTYGNNGWLGLAQIWITGGTHITQGAVKLNDTYFNTSTYNNPNERLHVMCQEVGHTFGLDHQSTNGSSQNTCMDYFSNTGANAGSSLSTHPNQHDHDELGIIYTHLDSTNTASLSTGGGNGKPASVGQDIDLNGPSAWGKAVSQDARGKNSLYERDLGNGEKLFTFVIWAQ
jgi:hypothetical protein